ncbi:DNA ligase [Methylomarinum sp. Ch1-1]|uniref:DNA ligase n=1 Tax=Methylomarinum roseum TaxID=3067653 RepID=A0AAU7NVP2_9GAMM|nr:DNA ligase [Methylomarinum sp. Ch1-1]MDP4522896.1 DNA ligase [Methylomarinum sp. Ch1-1]
MNNANRHSLVRLPVILLFLFVASAAAKEKPDIMQAKIFRPSIDVTEYWVSEKLDGVRARWNGKQLISKNGHLFHAPAWFTEGFPDVTLDGELWLARGQYQQTISIVSRKTPHSGWRKVKLMVFDLPDKPKPFSGRVSAMRRMAKQLHAPYLGFIKQFRVVSGDELKQRLDQIVAGGGEGLMLHRQDSLYQYGRSDRLLKLKPYHDAEAVVIGYRPGKGQFTGKMGALKVRTENGKEFYIGTGFSHRERKNPPPLGSLISFRHQGYTDNGIPRFAVFIRIREEP